MGDELLNQRYLGDGVYVGHDGFQLGLICEGKIIYIEYNVYERLKVYGESFFHNISPVEKPNE